MGNLAAAIWYAPKILSGLCDQITELIQSSDGFLSRYPTYIPTELRSTLQANLAMETELSGHYIRCEIVTYARIELWLALCIIRSNSPGSRKMGEPNKILGMSRVALAKISAGRASTLLEGAIKEQLWLRDGSSRRLLELNIGDFRGGSCSRLDDGI
jgi:hypothetical protein